MVNINVHNIDIFKQSFSRYLIGDIILYFNIVTSYMFKCAYICFLYNIIFPYNVNILALQTNKFIKKELLFAEL